MKRNHISDRTKLATMVCMWLELPDDLSKAMPEAEILGLVEWDHWPVRKADGGEDAHYNIRPLLRHDHKLKTERDAAEMAKDRRVVAAKILHLQRMVAKAAGEPRPERKPKWWRR